MATCYIPSHLLRQSTDFSYYLITPYKTAFYNFKISIPSKHSTIQKVAQASFRERQYTSYQKTMHFFKHVGVATLLMIPIFNFFLFIGLLAKEKQIEPTVPLKPVIPSIHEQPPSITSEKPETLPPLSIEAEAIPQLLPEISVEVAPLPIAVVEMSSQKSFEEQKALNPNEKKPPLSPVKKAQAAFQKQKEKELEEALNKTVLDGKKLPSAPSSPAKQAQARLQVQKEKELEEKINRLSLIGKRSSEVSFEESDTLTREMTKKFFHYFPEETKDPEFERLKKKKERADLTPLNEDVKYVEEYIKAQGITAEKRLRFAHVNFPSLINFINEKFPHLKGEFYLYANYKTEIKDLNRNIPYLELIKSLLCEENHLFLEKLHRYTYEVKTGPKEERTPIQIHPPKASPLLNSGIGS